MACLQICLQTGQHRLKPNSTGSNLLTIKTRLPLGTEGIAWYHQKSHKPLKTRYAVLLSDRPLVRIQFGVPAQKFPTPLRFPPLAGNLRYVGNFFAFRRDLRNSRRRGTGAADRLAGPRFGLGRTAINLTSGLRLGNFQHPRRIPGGDFDSKILRRDPVPSAGSRGRFQEFTRNQSNPALNNAVQRPGPRA